MPEKPVQLSATERRIVRTAIVEVCRHEGWLLYGLHVRSTHVHAVVQSPVAPKNVIGKYKAYASRALNARFGFRKRRWARHGSTRRLWSPLEVDAALHYVVHQQGEPMEVYELVDRWSVVLGRVPHP